MNPKTTALALAATEALPAPVGAGDDILTNPAALAHALAISERIAASQFVPATFKGKPNEVLMAMMLARDMREPLFTVLNAVHFVGNRPGWASAYLIARANQSGIFESPLEFEITGEGASLAATCSATVKATGKRVSRTVTMETARKEQWTRNAKYASIPDQMLCYRAATFLLRLTAPQLFYGLRPADELADIAASRGAIVESEAEYSDPDPSPRSRERPSPSGVAAPDARVPQREPVPDERGVPSLAASAGAGDPDGSCEFESRAPASTSPAPSPTVSSDSGAAPVGSGEGPADEHRARVLAEVGELRELCPDLLKEVAQSMGLKSPAKAPTLRLEELVATVRQRLEQAAAEASVSTAARETLLEGARLVLAELSTDEAEVVLAEAGVTGTLDEATELQLRKVVVRGGGAR